MKPRIATITRTTKETDISLTINLDGNGICKSDTGIGFLDHMMDGFARHGLFDIELTVKGDLYVDSHHTIEDTGIVFGHAIAKAVGDKKGIKRYGNFALPMDETLILCAIDLSGRPYYVSDVTYTVERLGTLDTEMISDFFYAVSYGAAMNLHFKQLYGSNNHHLAEASFKAFAKALDMATMYDERITGVLSTKGSL